MVLFPKKSNTFKRQAIIIIGTIAEYPTMHSSHVREVFVTYVKDRTSTFFFKVQILFSTTPTLPIFVLPILRTYAPTELRSYLTV